jgi:hypothetical protein
MANISIKELFPSDSLVNAVEKINFNFDQVILGGGGPQGEIGVTGPAGGQGPEGDRGNAWFAGTTYGGITGDYFGNPLELGDGFVSGGGTVYIYSYTGGSTGWLNTGISLIGPTGPDGATGGSFEWQYYRGATDIGVNSWIPATAFGPTTIISSNRDILSYVGAEKNIVFMGSTSWAQDQLSDFGFFPSGSNLQKQLSTLTVIQRYVDDSTPAGILIGAVGLTSGTGGTLPTPGDLTASVSALDFTYFGFEETSADTWINGTPIHRSVIHSPNMNFAIRVGGTTPLESSANFYLESQYIKFNDYLNEKSWLTGNDTTGSTPMDFHHIFAKSVGFNPLSTGVGKQGSVVIQGVEGSYSVGTYQHRLGNTIIGTTAGLAGNVVAGLIISRGNTGGISAVNNYDAHISIHANNTANAIAKLIGSVDSIGVPRTQLATTKFGIVGPFPGATGSTGFLRGAWNSEAYTPKVPFHVIQDSGNLISINGSGQGISGLTLPINLSGLRVLGMDEVVNARGGGLLQGLTPAYNIISSVGGSTATYAWDDIVLQTFARGATNPSPNIWINPGGTTIGGSFIVGLPYPTTASQTLTGATGQFIRSKMAIGGSLTIGSIEWHRDYQPAPNGIRLQGSIYQGITTNYPGASAGYALFGYYGGTSGMASEGIVSVGDEIFNRTSTSHYQFLVNAGFGGMPSIFGAAFQSKVIIEGGNAFARQNIVSGIGPTAPDASLLVGGYSIFGPSSYANQWYGNIGPWFTGGLIANVGVFGDPILGYSSFGLGYPETAALSVNSTTKGFAPPRMDQTQRLAMGTSLGLMVYQTTGTPGAPGPTGQGIYVFASTGWTGPMRFS